MLPERTAGEQRDAGLLQQPVGEHLRVDAGVGDVREGVERALRQRAANAGKRVQTAHQQVAALNTMLPLGPS